ncbi:MAG: hypothetical protein WCG15_04510, partial [Actinomycetes bacterium]
NKELLGLAGAAAGAMSPGAQYGKSGYQGSIPLLSATRNMITAPPKTGYRPGAGGINYGGDVTYSRLPAGTDPWANLRGDSGSAAGANLTPVTPPTGGISDLPINDQSKTSVVTPTVVTPKPTDWRKGMSDQQYLSAINQWIASNPGLSTNDLVAAMAKFGVSQTDLQTALGQNKNLSAADIYALSHGMGLKEANAQQTAGIMDWISKNPYATADQIKAAIKASGVNTGDINEALAGTKLSGAMKSALTGGMGVDQLYKNILNYQAANHTPEEIAAIKAKSGVTDEDIAAAQKYATAQNYTVQPPAAPNVENSLQNLLATQKIAPTISTKDIQNWLGEHKGASDKDIATEMFKYNITPAQMAVATGLSEKEIADRQHAVGYAEGGMAQGRYLQGGTDGMADEIPAKIGEDQPAALSHGEFVVPADVVSHLGNGNSDAGAKKLYQMMDKIRMARTGNKKQGKKINPDKFMPGGLAAAYAAGGKVKKYSGENTSLVTANNTAASNPGIAGVESNLSNWAGDYTTNMLGQGQALANMPYQQYMGPLTAGESTLQNKVSKGLEGLSFPGNIGKSFSSSGAYTPSQMTMGQEQPLGTNGDFSTAQSTAQPTGIASQYMNPYLQSVLNPQLEELRRQSQINLQPGLAKLTQAGGYGGGRQAIMESEANRNLLTAQNQAIGTGYANAYDKAQQQFNTEQGQSNTLANMMAQQGATQRAIESEGIAADKAQFEEARANPYKMVQFQQSLLQGLPLDAKSYQGIQQSDIVKAAQGATTVNQLLKNLGLIT